jgi:hypothetical protein
MAVNFYTNVSMAQKAFKYPLMAISWGFLAQKAILEWEGGYSYVYL